METLFFCCIHNSLWTESTWFLTCGNTIQIMRKFTQRTAEVFVSTGIKTCIDSCNKSLTGCFFVSAGSVYLTCIKHTCNTFCFQRRIQLSWLYIIIFNSVTRAALNSIFKTWHSSHKSVLNTFWQRRRKSVQINFVSFKTFWLNKNLMAFTFCKSHNFVFYGRTIARSNTADFSAVQRRSPDIFTDNFVSFFVSVNNMTRNHRTFNFFSFKAERNYVFIAILNFQFRKINCTF